MERERRFDPAKEKQNNGIMIPLNNHVLIEREPNKTESGIILPDENTAIMKGTIVAVAQDVTQVKTGDKVYFKPSEEIESKHLVPESNLLATYV